jgi:putative membrane protein (TIGR04086 family)
MKTIFRTHLKAVFFAITITMIGVLAIALGLTSVGFNENITTILMQIVKVISIFIGVMVIARRVNSMAWMHGGLLGIIYTAITFVILSIIDGDFNIASGFLVEIIFAIIVGVFCAMLLRLRKRDV